METPALRIASHSPAATRWICAFGAARSLVARSDTCDFTREDIDRLRALSPDVVVVEHPCGVPPAWEALFFSRWGGPAASRPQLHHFAPCTLKQVLNEALRLGRAIGCTAAAMEWIAGAEKELQALRSQLGLSRRGAPAGRPRVVALESLVPLRVAGRWVPDLIELAGGQAVLAEAGAAPRGVTWAEIAEHSIDVLAVMPAGRTLEHTRHDFNACYDRVSRYLLKSVRRIYLFDGRVYFNRPGPRLYRSIALLAAALRPEVQLTRPVKSWEMERYQPLKR